jgi:hypothetical protein
VRLTHLGYKDVDEAAPVVGNHHLVRPSQLTTIMWLVAKPFARDNTIWWAAKDTSADEKVALVRPNLNSKVGLGYTGIA